MSRDYANRDAIENPMNPEERRAAAGKGAALARRGLKSLGIDNIVRQERERSEAETDPDYQDRIEQAEQRAITARLKKHFDEQQR